MQTVRGVFITLESSFRQEPKADSALVVTCWERPPSFDFHGQHREAESKTETLDESARELYSNPYKVGDRVKAK